jgi:hypothetical protein
MNYLRGDLGVRLLKGITPGPRLKWSMERHLG